MFLNKVSVLPQTCSCIFGTAISCYFSDDVYPNTDVSVSGNSTSAHKYKLQIVLRNHLTFVEIIIIIIIIQYGQN